MTRGDSTNTSSIDWDSDATELVEGAITYIREQFSCFRDAPLTHFMVFNLKTWSYNEGELKTFGHYATSALVEAFRSALKKAACSVEGMHSQWGK